MGEPFEKSEAWKSARVLTNEVYLLCRREPLRRDFGLRDQLQRAAVSVMNNVAEGWESLHSAENVRPTMSHVGRAGRFVP
jgi:four helix bundle protein